MEKRAIVIGASSGIGREVAKLLMQEGWTVGVAARRVDKLQELLPYRFLTVLHAALVL